MQELIGNLTVEQFTQFMGMLLGCLGIGVLFIAVLFSIFDGWLFRKGALYYGSLRYLNKLFKKLRHCETVHELYDIRGELTHVINLLCFQMILPKILIKRFLCSLDDIFHSRYIDLINGRSD